MKRAMNPDGSARPGEFSSYLPEPHLPGPVPPLKPLSFFSFLRTMQDNAIAVYDERAYEEWLVETKFFRLRNFILNDPEGIRRVLLDHAANYAKGNIEPQVGTAGVGRKTNPGEEARWHARRRLALPAFDYRSVSSYVPIMTEAAERLLSQWDSSPPGTVVDLAGSSCFQQVTVEVISRRVFSSDSEEIARLVAEFMTRRRSEIMIHPLDFIPFVDKVWARYRNRRERRAFADVMAAIERLVASRSAEQTPSHDDFLDRLIAAQEEGSDRRIGRAEAQGNALTILMVGHETVTWTLAWIWYMLSQHPTEEAKVHAELDSVLGGRTPTQEDIARLPYTRMFVEETMRLYPPFHTLAWRETLADDELCGRPIPKGTIISIVPWVLHRHRKLWEDPERFDPERFSPERSVGRSRFAYLPFGMGPRVCIGAVFAMTQIMLVLATLAQRYRLRLAPGHRVEPQARVMLRTRSGMKMVLEKR
jgi:cytochrome P450